MALVAELSCWLGDSGLGAGDLSGEVMETFFAAAGGRLRRRRSPRSLRAVVGHLRSLGVLAPETVAWRGRAEAEAELVAAFGTWRGRAWADLGDDRPVHLADGALPWRCGVPKERWCSPSLMAPRCW